MWPCKHKIHYTIVTVEDIPDSYGLLWLYIIELLALLYISWWTKGNIPSIYERKRNSDLILQQKRTDVVGLTHWNLVMIHLCVNGFAVIGSRNGILPVRYQAIT